MSSTNKTPNLQLSQFEPYDTPKWQYDYNEDMRKIDEKLKPIDTPISGSNLPFSAGGAYMELAKKVDTSSLPVEYFGGIGFYKTFDGNGVAIVTQTDGSMGGKIYVSAFEDNQTFPNNTDLSIGDTAIINFGHNINSIYVLRANGSVYVNRVFNGGLLIRTAGIGFGIYAIIRG